MSSLNLEQIKDYKDNGFVAPINVLSLEEVKKIKEEQLKFSLALETSELKK